MISCKIVCKFLGMYGVCTIKFHTLSSGPRSTRRNFGMQGFFNGALFLQFVDIFANNLWNDFRDKFCDVISYEIHILPVRSEITWSVHMYSWKSFHRNSEECVSSQQGQTTRKYSTTTHEKCVSLLEHDDVIKWKHFPRYWPFVRGIHQSHRGNLWVWCFLWFADWINSWVNNREAGDLRRHHAHNDVILMCISKLLIAIRFLRSAVSADVNLKITTFLTFSFIFDMIGYEWKFWVSNIDWMVKLLIVQQ